jgi:hypothetical protein
MEPPISIPHLIESYILGDHEVDISTTYDYKATITITRWKG